MQYYCGDFEKEQLLFGLKVFIELNIFAVASGKLVHNEKIKNALTNSKIYSKKYVNKILKKPEFCKIIIDNFITNKFFTWSEICKLISFNILFIF